MSKSVGRVEAALREARLGVRIVELGDCRTAEDAAAACDCGLDQIVKSILFADDAGGLALFLTAGGNRVDPDRASALAGRALGRADAGAVRAATGFAIGGVPPLGHLTPVPAWWDPRLSKFDEVWAAAGTPRHVFAAPPGELLRATGAKPAAFTA
ncbi:YbaK/EbsC family protein [Paracoccus sp. S-4012]|uniref:YbaK/EbsC family protein n=1 Tax=Paracoccus sp. S-4012 TaxID=2665648 RepID=UPI0012B06A89|nr:YbaK/EbsC family protein [Paracoccus sp. S-4012]MRX49501.1 YbaK/EbsC family protein [Paracoccus sp. S-4012]